MVVLPDYQGLGIGKKILNITSKNESKKYQRIFITTSLKGFGRSLMADKHWHLIHTGHLARQNHKILMKTDSSTRNTYSFRYRNTEHEI
jgi:GNAT superfamily N-acetyltransferase